MREPVVAAKSLLPSVSAASFLLAWGGAVLIGYPGRPPVPNVVSLFAVVIGLVTLLRFARLFVVFVRTGEEKPLRAWLSATSAAFPRWIEITLSAALLAVFLVSMGWLKAMIPIAVPFWADGPLAAIDRSIGIYVPPLWPLVFAYGLWQPAQLLGILWVIHWRERQVALATYLFTWSIGMALAFAFSSAGPIFTGAKPPDALTGLEARYLWANYMAGGATIGGGISAFPSMHVAIACWVALILRLRGIKYVGELFVLLVCLGAVALRWHYWMDVVGGLAVFGAAYWICRPSRQPTGSTVIDHQAGARFTLKRHTF